jgi:hypothetical protein
MKGINYSRVLLGGLLAGVVANVLDFAWTLVTAHDFDLMAQRLNLNRSVLNAPSTAVAWVVIDFVYATLIVWTYAAIRPRFGPGPKTAVRAAVAIWGATTIVLHGYQHMGVFTTIGFAKSAALTLITAVVAALVGARVYREP